jgi:UDP-glucuronate decarboxylase
MRVLITGVAGFLGSHLARKHLDRGDDVWGIDNHSTSMGPNSAHFLALMADPRFNFREGDIRYLTTDWHDESTPFGRIYNFACPASPPKYQAMPIQTMLTCVEGTYKVLQVARLHGAVVVHASTSEVYGDPTVSPQPESYRGYVNSYGPRACYDEGKRAAEALCYDFRHQYGVHTRIVRIFNTYGPHMDPADGRVVTNFIKQALSCEPITIYGSGCQTRSFCYVDDLIRGIISLGDLAEDDGTPINLGNPHEFTVNELAEKVIALTGSQSGIVVGALPPDDPLQRRPHIEQAKLRLNWRPHVPLDEGLVTMVEYVRGLLQNT